MKFESFKSFLWKQIGKYIVYFILIIVITCLLTGITKWGFSNENKKNSRNCSNIVIYNSNGYLM